jgi:hypothetical protein
MGIMHVPATEKTPPDANGSLHFTVGLLTCAMCLITGILGESYYYRHKTPPDVAAKQAQVDKLAEREKALQESVKRWAERRDAARGELIGLTAALAGGKMAMNAEAPLSDTTTQVVILEIHVKK